jgi:hypothetical protein
MRTRRGLALAVLGLGAHDAVIRPWMLHWDLPMRNVGKRFRLPQAGSAADSHGSAPSSRGFVPDLAPIDAAPALTRHQGARRSPPEQPPRPCAGTSSGESVEVPAEGLEGGSRRMGRRAASP